MFFRLKNKDTRMIGLTLMLLAAMSFIVPQPKITIWMIGDSTMSKKEAKAYPETGWGMELGSFFDPSVTIENRALNGRSTKSFINENHWQPVLENIKVGDYVFIEFGHNDEKIDKPAVGTSIDVFKINLIKFVLETREKGGIPILLTPITRRSFKNGELADTHGLYPAATISVADSLKVPLIDMLSKSKKLVRDLGDEASKSLYNYVDSGSVNYPTGKMDNTHLSPTGAKKIAALAVDGIVELKLELSKRLLKN
jgi:lysophospholipase L1-like esterase